MTPRALCLFTAVLVAASSLYFLLPRVGVSRSLSERMDSKRAQIQRADRREGVLTETIAGYGVRISSLEGEIGGLQRQRARAEADLARRRAKLLQVRAQLAEARDRLAALRAELAVAERALARRLVELYKADAPDVLTVVLDSDGFADLLERMDFLRRVADQDERVISRVRTLKERAEAETRNLAELESAAQLVADLVLARRNEIASTEQRLVRTRNELAAERGRRAATLTRVRQSRARAEEDLAALAREQARVTSELRGAPGPIREGSGELIWPISGTVTSPFGSRWGRLHAGLDIAAPEGTAIRAADSGRVALAAYTGGYGNYTCVQHTSAMSTCYAHQSRFGTSAGASVTQGQVIGYVGNTGNSFGAHLHFEVRVNGQPVDPLGYL